METGEGTKEGKWKKEKNVPPKEEVRENSMDFSVEGEKEQNKFSLEFV